MNFALASSLIRGKWAIDPMFALNSLGMVADILNGNIAIERTEKSISELKPVASRPRIGIIGAGNAGSPARVVALTRLEGPLMKSDQECGPAGMESIGNALRMMDSNPNVAAHVLLFDTPGGTVDGTEVLGNIIKNLEKPSVAFISGQCASAGLWLASNATERYASTELDEIGSVGVLLSFADMQPYYEKEGVKFHKIVSNLSPDKTKMWDDIRAGKYEEYTERFLDPIAEKFQAVIRENLPNVTDDHLTGKVFHARDLIGIMINGISTLDEAIARASELAEAAEAAAQTTAHSPIKNKVSMKLPKLMALLALTELVAEEGFSSLSEDQLQTIEAALPGADDVQAVETAQQNMAELQQQLDQTSEALAASTATVETQQQRIAQLETENAALRGTPAEPPATAVTESDASANDLVATAVKPGMTIHEQMEAVKATYGL